MKLILVCAGLSLAAAANPDYPEVEPRARVKQPRGVQEGEDFRLKAIIKWKQWEGALSYEVCHDCDIDDASGVRTSERGKTIASAVSYTCGGTPCAVFPDLTKGKHTYSVRANDAEGWSRWSPRRNFIVEQHGFAEHSEL